MAIFLVSDLIVDGRSSPGYVANVQPANMRASERLEAICEQVGHLSDQENAKENQGKSPPGLEWLNITTNKKYANLHWLACGF